MGAAVAVMAMKERQLVEAFERAGAISPATAVSEGEIGADVSHMAWRRLHRRAVIRESSPESRIYYVDREVWEAVRSTRRRMAAIILSIVVIAGLLVAAVNVFGS